MASLTLPSGSNGSGLCGGSGTCCPAPTTTQHPTAITAIRAATAGRCTFIEMTLLCGKGAARAGSRTAPRSNVLSKPGLHPGGCDLLLLLLLLRIRVQLGAASFDFSEIVVVVHVG